MDWVKFRDSILDKIQIEEVTEDMKEAFVKWFKETVFPAVKEAGIEFVSEVKKQSETEKGWCKVRDLIAIPFMVEGSLWVIEYTLNKISPA